MAVETTAAQKEQIKLLHKRGLSSSQIARELGMRRQTVHKWLARLVHGTVSSTPKPGGKSIVQAAEVDYSRAKYTRHVMRPDPSWPIRNGLMTEPLTAKHLTAR